MSGIAVDPALMSNYSRQYNAESVKIGEVIHNMDGLRDGLERDWQGQASQAYSQRYTELRRSFEAARDLANEISIALQKVSDQYQDTDSSIAGALRG